MPVVPVQPNGRCAVACDVTPVDLGLTLTQRDTGLKVHQYHSSQRANSIPDKSLAPQEVFSIQRFIFPSAALADDTKEIALCVGVGWFR